MATFGFTSIGAPTASGTGFNVGNPFVLPIDATVSKISLYVDTLSLGGADVVTGIYTQSAGNPGALVGYSDAAILSGGAAGAWVDFPLISGGVLTAGTYYLCYLPDSVINVSITADPIVQRPYREPGYTSPPPNPYGSPDGTGTDTISIYATYTTSAVPPVADFTGTPTSGVSPLSVAFTDLSTNTPTSWLWEKNNGTGWVNFSGSPTSQNPTESFS